ncbi:MAG TPA: hypothetical protein VJ808_00765 [Gemmatimonadales bacterium]|nr:hypothetical protein [Gemmatimonadales bacterium]
MIDRLLTSGLMVCGIAGVSSAQAVPLEREPRHRVVLDAGTFRIFDVQIPPGDTTLFHIHRFPQLLIPVSVSPTDAQLADSAWAGTLPSADPGWHPGDVVIDSSFVQAPLTHRVTNVGTQLFRLILINHSHSAHNKVSGSPPGSPGEPGLHSSWFLQSRLIIPAQSVTKWETASLPTILVQPLGGHTSVSVSDRPEQALEGTGAWLSLPAGVRYRVRNVGSQPGNIVVVQIR